MDAIYTYLEQIEKAITKGNATEHTHRPALKTLVESFQQDIIATNEPKRIECGAPDFIVTQGGGSQGDIPLGYIEAKDINDNLDKTENSSQLKRYRESLSNLILTDYLKFRWFVRGDERADEVRLARVGKNGKLLSDPDSVEALEKLFRNFFTVRVPTVSTPKELAGRMASLARLIHTTIETALESDIKDASHQSVLENQMESFKKVLLPDLTPHLFADLYAQTIAYGLFSARTNTRNPPFTRQNAAHSLPRTNPFLRQLFDNIAGINLDDRITWAVDDLAELLNRSDMSAILSNFGKRTRQEDPVVHFYETFLHAYDPALRETRGVYYTPEPVVSYIVRSVDKILQNDFGLPKGLADSSKIKIPSARNAAIPSRNERESIQTETHRVLILDPAAGTGTFLFNVIKQVAKRFENNKGMWDGYVSEHLLPRIFGFELLVAPYTVAHLKLGLLLEETGYKFHSDERLRVYLTNTLEEIDRLTQVGGLTQWLTEEADAAGKVKQEAPVMVVLGNPPYSGHSANTGEWIKKLLHGIDTHTGKSTGNYFEVDGKPLGERNPKWLNDDYVKFIRFAQWRIAQTGYGILAFVTNHGYLDNPTFRGMRQSLMETFDEIYILDLHGNSKKKEKAPDGSKDENVFDIQQGVAIGIFVKKQSVSTPSVSAESLGRVHHQDLYGLREIVSEPDFFDDDPVREIVGGKYHWLAQNSVETTKWEELQPQTPHYLFIPQDITLKGEYEKYWLITNIFDVFASTVTTARNDFSVAYDSETLVTRVADMRNKAIPDTTIRDKFGLKDVSYWKLSEARAKLREVQEPNSFIKPYCFRPFDFRYVYYHGAVCERLRTEVMAHMRDGNIAFLTHRPQSPGEFTFAYCTNAIGDQCVAANKTGGGGNSFQFPLYVYPTEKRTLFDEEIQGRKPNFSDAFIREFSAKLNLEFRVGAAEVHSPEPQTFLPEDIFHYAYAIFHSPVYRARYAEFLKIDFPRLPLTSNQELFFALVNLGGQLVSLHLLEKDIETDVTFPEKGSNEIEFAPKYNDGKVWINKKQYFEGVPANAWEFQIGGYRVADKWLKDRKGRNLSFDDMDHYAKTIAALSKTIELMREIDEVIEHFGGFPLA